MRTCTLAIVSDIHYASAAEQARGDDYEYRDLPNPLIRNFVRYYRRFVWLHNPLRQNHLLERFLAEAGEPDYVVANGDYSCDSQFIGVSDEAACESARECLGKLRAKFGGRLRANVGDHELGKLSFMGRRGGMRLASWRRATTELGLEPFWQVSIGRYELIGLASSLVGLPLLEGDMLANERGGWEQIRREHMGQVRAAFEGLGPERRVLLFCHDPSALPFLGAEEAVRIRLRQIEQTIVGHLHSNLVMRQSQRLAGMPAVGFLGHTARRLSASLRQARNWKPFQVRLCPSLAGLELLHDGGFYRASIDPEGNRPVRFQFQRLPRH